MPTQPSTNRNLKLAACAVAFATAMGSSALASSHEAETIDNIQRYCNVSWRNAGISQQEWEDCTQQALVELLDRLSRDELHEAITNVASDQRRELNRTVWRTVQRWRRRPRASSLDALPDSFVADVTPTSSHREAWEELAAIGQSCLSPRQRTILALVREGYRASEIAERLEITPARVSDEKYKAIAKLRQALRLV